MNDSMTDKTELRQVLRERLAALPSEDTAGFNTRITEQFISSQGFMPHSNIAGYMPLKGEVSCMAILENLNRQSHILCLPVVEGRNIPLLFRHYRPGDPVRRGMLGPQEPLPSAREIIPDALIIPMLGFTRQGYRLGYGTGFYDRTLEVLRQLKPIKTIGVAFSAQEIDDLPIEPHDVKLDLIITEKEIIRT